MAIEPENFCTHDCSSSPFFDRQNDLFVRLSRKRKLSIDVLAKYSTLISTSQSGVNKRKTVSVLDCDLLPGLLSAGEAVAVSPSAARHHRNERRADRRDKSLSSEGAAITLSNHQGPGSIR